MIGREFIVGPFRQLEPLMPRFVLFHPIDFDRLRRTAPAGSHIEPATAPAIFVASNNNWKGYPAVAKYLLAGMAPPKRISHRLLSHPVTTPRSCGNANSTWCRLGGSLRAAT